MGELQKNTYVVLLAGGGGTRLWPSSRSKLPKQFNKILAKRTLFQETVRRVRGLVPLSHIYVITNKDYVDDIARQEPMIMDENIIAEPEKKNTALAMGVAAAYVYRKNPNAVIINLATDHLITEEEVYKKTLLDAAQFALETQNLVSVGIVPSFAHTGLGYIKAGEKVDSVNHHAVYKVDSFKEKPDLDTAEKFIKQGHYYWNANNYVWPAKTILEEFSRLSADIYQNISEIYKSIGTSSEKATLKEQYAKAREDSIDYAISEKTDKLFVIPGRFGWNDVGDWKVVYDLVEKDENGNHLAVHGDRGRCLTVDTKNCLVQTEDQLIATIGVDDLIIIDTKDALLVCRKDRAQDVKQLVALIKEKKLKNYL